MYDCSQSGADHNRQQSEPAVTSGPAIPVSRRLICERAKNGQLGIEPGPLDPITRVNYLPNHGDKYKDNRLFDSFMKRWVMRGKRETIEYVQFLKRLLSSCAECERQLKEKPSKSRETCCKN